MYVVGKPQESVSVQIQKKPPIDKESIYLCGKYIWDLNMISICEKIVEKWVFIVSHKTVSLEEVPYSKVEYICGKYKGKYML